VAKLAGDGSSLIFSTFLGGGSDGTTVSGYEYAYSLAVDGNGDICVTGSTSSPDFPVVNAFQPVHAPGTYRNPLDRFPIRLYFNSDAFVAKLKGDGSELVFSTFLGGTAGINQGYQGNDSGQSIAISGNGDIYLTGSTASIDFPTANPLQPANGGSGNDVFIAKFDRNGSLISSTYFGGSSTDYGRAISLDGAGNVYLLGETFSTNFPTVSPLYPTYAGNVDLFVAKLNPTMSAILYSTYLGGSDRDYAVDLKVDAQGSAYLIGHTISNDFPTVNPIQTVPNPGGQCPLPSIIPGQDVVFARLNASGSSLIYSSYLGGSCYETGSAINLDSSGNVYLIGSTDSPNFPVTPGAFQTVFSPQVDPYSREAFIIKIGQ
jgi:hypothetical protein